MTKMLYEHQASKVWTKVTGKACGLENKSNALAFIC